jgi:hypothetical protein
MARPGFVSAQTLVLESFADLSGWKAGTENNTGAKGRFAKTGATATLVIDQDTPGKDVLEYSKTFNRNLGENNALVVRYKTAVGSYFSLRAIVDGQAQQLLSFQEGNGQWREYSAPISGIVLQSVTLSIAEPRANTQAVIAEKLRSEFAWMKLAKGDAPKLNLGPNLLQSDGTLEAAKVGDDLGRGWTRSTYNSENIKYSVTDRNPHSGRLAQKFEVTKPGQISGIALNNVALEPGKKYLVRGWIRGEQLRLNKVLVEIFKEKLDYHQRQNNIYATTNLPVRETWSAFEIEVKAPDLPDVYKAGDTMAVVFWMDESSKINNSGAIVLDDLSIHELPEEKLSPNNLLYNGGFELGMAGWRLSYLDWKAKRKLSEDLKQPPSFATTGAPQGKRALKVTLPHAPETAVRIDINSLPFEAKSGSKVVLSYWAKIEGQSSGAQNFGIVVRAKSGSGYGEKDRGGGGALTNQWKQFVIPITLADDAQGIYRVWAACHITTPAPNGKPTVLYIDGLQLTYGEQVKPFTEREELNLGFETPANHPEDHMYVRTEITTANSPAVKVLSNARAAASRPWELQDVFGTTVGSGVINFKAGLGEQTLKLPSKLNGAFKLIVFRDAGRARALREYVYHIIPRRAAMALKPDSPFGIHISTNEYSIRLAQKIGVRWQRQFGDFTWSGIEPEKGRYELETPLENLRRFGKYKIMVLPNLGMPPAWARGGEGHDRPHTPTNWEDYRAFLQKLTKSADLENLGGWETYNEPNLDYKGSPEQNARDAFFEYSKRTYEMLKPLTKKPVVNQVSAANFQDGWMKEMLERGISKYADELSYHYYISGSDPLENNFGQTIVEWNAQMKSHGAVKPLHMSEGFVSGSGAIGTWYEYMPKVLTGTVLDNAVLNIRSFIGTMALSVKRSFPYHAYGDSPRYGETASSDLWGGFMEGDGVPLPVMSAYAVMTSQLEDMKYVQSGKVAGSVSYHVFQGPGGIVAVAWDDEGVKRKVSLPLQVLGVTDFMGNAAAFENKGNATTITIDRTPVYLKLKALPAKNLAVSLTSGIKAAAQ